MVALITWKKGKQQNETETTVPNKPIYFSSQDEKKNQPYSFGAPGTRMPSVNSLFISSALLTKAANSSYPGLLGRSDVVRVHMPFLSVHITHLKDYFPMLWEALQKCTKALPHAFHLQPCAGEWTLAAAWVLPPDDSAWLIKQA